MCWWIMRFCALEVFEGYIEIVGFFNGGVSKG